MYVFGEVVKRLELLNLPASVKQHKVLFEAIVVKEVDNAVVTVEAGNKVEAAVEEVEKAGNEVAVTEKRLVDEVFLPKLTMFTKLLTRIDKD